MEKNSQEIIEESVASVFSGEIVRLRWAVDGRPICPVCGCKWHPGAESAWTKTGEFSNEGMPIVEPCWSSCTCCDTEFGNDDVPGPNGTLESSWASLRERWLQKTGMIDSSLQQLKNNLGINI